MELLTTSSTSASAWPPLPGGRRNKYLDVHMPSHAVTAVPSTNSTNPESREGSAARYGRG